MYTMSEVIRGKGKVGFLKNIYSSAILQFDTEYL